MWQCVVIRWQCVFITWKIFQLIYSCYVNVLCEIIMYKEARSRVILSITVQNKNSQKNLPRIRVKLAKFYLKLGYHIMNCQFPFAHFVTYEYRWFFLNYRFIGTSQDSSSIRPLLDSINDQIMAVYAPDLPRKQEEMVGHTQMNYINNKYK